MGDKQIHGAKEAVDERAGNEDTQVSTFRWTEEAILKLIDEVEQYPIFYDKSNVNYNKKRLKHGTWVQISNAMNFQGFHVDDKECQRKWKYLSDHYQKLKRDLPSGSGLEALEERTTWQYFDALSFLDRHQKSREGISSQDFVESPDSRQSAIEDDDQVEVFASTSSPSPSSPPEATVPRKKKRRQEEAALNELIADSTRAIESALTVRESDDCDHFGAMVASAMRRLPEGQIRESAKIRISELIYRMEFGEGVVE
uniref:MADF domain-containing protein n=1 Tax=Steinernema glaseri TaxID=37863 RepID=A0A1I7Y492_9BILA